MIFEIDGNTTRLRLKQLVVVPFLIWVLVTECVYFVIIHQPADLTLSAFLYVRILQNNFTKKEPSSYTRILTLLDSYIFEATVIKTVLY